MHVADYGLRCSVGQEAVWLHGKWHEECREARWGVGLLGHAALIQMGLSFPGQYWGLVA